jgi:hypothetical protein
MSVQLNESPGHICRILASAALILTFVPLGAFGQESSQGASTFSERFPADQTAPQTPAEAVSPEQRDVTGTRDVRVRTRLRSANRTPPRVVVVPRSFLDAGTEVLPGERKFTDYAYPPAYTPLDVVTNTGGRVGWHRSPLPGPFDLPSRRNPFGF